MQRVKTREHMQPQCHALMCSWYKARENMQILSHFLRDKALGTNQGEKYMVFGASRKRARIKNTVIYTQRGKKHVIRERM